MPTTVSRRAADKYAFLFTADTSSRYISDLKNVFDTLTGYYNYPASNIWVVQGSNAFQNASYFPNANMVAVGAAALPKDALRDAFHTGSSSLAVTISAQLVSNPPPSGENCSLIVYITGSGSVNAGVTDLVVKQGTAATEVVMTPAEFALMLQHPFNPPTSVTTPLLLPVLTSVIMQQDYAGIFENEVMNNALIDNKSFSAGCGSGELATNGSTGSLFTESWCSALRFEQLSGISPSHPDYDKFADQLGPYVDEFRYLISFENAVIFANLKAGVTNFSFIQAFTGSDTAMFPGLPEFLIQDGQSWEWWESPDLYLTHPNSGTPLKENDLYIPDPLSATAPYNNTINVKVRNIGTHPVRKYRLGIRVYRTPAGGALDTFEENGRIPAGIVLRPVVQTAYNTFNYPWSDKFLWNTPFYTGTTHECLWAKAELPVVDNAANPFNFGWNVLANNNEAQRNTDQGADPPKDPRRPKPGDQFRGSKSHIYEIMNPFDKRHLFVITTLPSYQKALEHAVADWYIMMNDGKWVKKKFETLDKGFRGLRMLLNPGEKVRLMCDFGFKPGAKVKEVRLPLEILVDKVDGQGSRKPATGYFKGTYSAMAGFTIILSNEQATLAVLVTDKKKNPLPNVTVEISTVNKMASEKFITPKTGEVVLKAINPDVYRIAAYSGKFKVEEAIIHADTGKDNKVNIVLPLKDLPKVPSGLVKPVKGRR